MKFKNKVAIITGSSRGIWKATALELAQNWASVVVSSTKLANCQKVVEEIKLLGWSAIAVQCDVSKSTDVNNLVDETIKTFGKIDILVNNAGVGSVKPFAEMTEEDRDFTMNINLKWVFLCTNAVVKHMLKQKSGKIVSIASILGKTGFMNASAYCASKAAIVNLTRSLAIELSPHNINVNVVAPWFIKTDMTKWMLEDENIKNMLLSQIPSGRFWEAEEIAKAVAFLASEDSNFTTWETLVVDGWRLTH